MGVAKALAQYVESGIVVAQVTSVDESGRAHVLYAGQTSPIMASSIIQSDDPASVVNKTVLLCIDEKAGPIIIGVIEETVCKISAGATNRVTSSGANINEAALYADGKKVTIDASREILLQCGQSSIRLESNGKITVKGRNVVSRASSSNSVKGATVKIN